MPAARLTVPVGSTNNGFPLNAVRKSSFSNCQTDERMSPNQCRESLMNTERPLTDSSPSTLNQTPSVHSTPANHSTVFLHPAHASPPITPPPPPADAPQLSVLATHHAQKSSETPSDDG